VRTIGLFGMEVQACRDRSQMESGNSLAYKLELHMLLLFIVHILLSLHSAYLVIDTNGLKANRNTYLSIETQAQLKAECNIIATRPN
jgi:Mn2+/Fe2+ NRAMP family transporter